MYITNKEVAVQYIYNIVDKLCDLENPRSLFCLMKAKQVDVEEKGLDLVEFARDFIQNPPKGLDEELVKDYFSKLQAWCNKYKTEFDASDPVRTELKLLQAFQAYAQQKAPTMIVKPKAAPGIPEEGAVPRAPEVTPRSSAITAVADRAQSPPPDATTPEEEEKPKAATDPSLKKKEEETSDVRFDLGEPLSFDRKLPKPVDWKATLENVDLEIEYLDSLLNAKSKARNSNGVESEEVPRKRPRGPD